MDIRLDELVLCNLCSAVLTRDSRATHLGWHARINAALYNIMETVAEIHERFERMEQGTV